MSNHNQILRNRIAETVKKQGRTLRGLMELMRKKTPSRLLMSYDALCRYANNERQPNRFRATTIANALDVSIKDLFYIPDEE